MAHLMPIVANIQSRRGKDGSTTFRVQVRLRGHPPVSRSFVRRTDARLWAQQMEASIRKGDALPVNEARKHTLGDLVDRYLEVIERRNPVALKDQKRILGWWKQELGAYALANITPALIAQKRDELLAEDIGVGAPRKRAPATVNRYLAAISKAFSEAVREMHWMKENPLRSVSKEKEPGGRVRFLSTKEQKALLKACQLSPLKELYLLVLLAVTTGMRRGEILGLRWSDIDLKRNQLVLHKTKNRERRAVPLVPQVSALLKKRLKAKRGDVKLVFPQPGTNKPLDPRHWFEMAVEAAGIEDFRFHDLRHTTASYLAMSGATASEIAAVLGHKTLHMVKRYAHLSDVHTSAVVGRMTQKFFSS